MTENCLLISSNLNLMTDNPWLQLLIVIGAAAVAYLFGRYVLIPLVHAAVSHTKAKWDDILLDRKVLHRLSLLLPLVPFVSGSGSSMDSTLRGSVSWRG